jgi:hypothetical protein
MGRLYSSQAVDAFMVFCFDRSFEFIFLTRLGLCLESVDPSEGFRSLAALTVRQFLSPRIRFGRKWVIESFSITVGLRGNRSGGTCLQSG